MAVDELVPELTDSAKYVLHGDFSQREALKTQSDQWALQVLFCSKCCIAP